jgi:hypothetical protein
MASCAGDKGAVTSERPPLRVGFPWAISACTMRGRTGFKCAVPPRSGGVVEAIGSP